MLAALQWDPTCCHDRSFCLLRPTNIGGSSSHFIMVPSACVSDMSLAIAYLARE